VAAIAALALAVYGLTPIAAGAAAAILVAGRGS
jgi:hypothetical protein